MGMSTPESTPHPPAEPLMTAREVAAHLGVPVSWVYAQTRAGALPCVHLGRYRRYRRASIDAWLQTQQHGPGATS